MVTKQHRIIRMKQKGVVIWLTGLPGSGKSTIASKLETALLEKGYLAYILDGDHIRRGLNIDLGFSRYDRKEHIRRVGEAAKLFCDANLITLVPVISPYRLDRETARMLFNEGDFVEVYIKCPLSICETRDPKGLYRKARAGEISEFTGISDPYEEPLTPDITLDTSILSAGDSVKIIYKMLEERGRV